MAEAHESGGISHVNVRVAWEHVEETPVLFVNQFMGLVGQNELFLLLGQVSPPAVLGNHEEQAEQIRQLPNIPIRTIARLGLSRERCEQLRDVLNATLENYDAAQLEAGTGEDGDQ